MIQILVEDPEKMLSLTKLLLYSLACLGGLTLMTTGSIETGSYIIVRSVQDSVEEFRDAIQNLI